MLRLSIIFSLLIAAGPVWAQGAPADEVVCQRAEGTPVIDGVPDEACWQRAALLESFTRPLSPDAPPKKITARLCFDAKHLYLAFRCAEPKPAALKTLARDGSDGVWKDDCVEVWVRAGDSLLQCDQFIVNAAGARQTVRARLRNGAPAGAVAWQAKARVGRDAWTVEMAIPFSLLGVPEPVPGTLLQLKLGREDYAGGGQALSTWPSRSPYGGVEGYGRLYFETSNILPNPDMALAQEGRPVGWGFGEKDRDLFSSVDDRGRRAIRFACPNRYSVAQQSLRLKPNSVYRLEARVRGAAGIYLRARTSAQKGAASTAYSVETRPGPDYQEAVVRFPTGNTGEALIIIGNYGGLGEGEVFISDLRVAQEVECDAEGPAIPVGAEPVTITKVPVTDCRALRGFVVAPVDGRLNSLNWNMATWEYGMRGAGAGVGYGYRNNDGLHVTLADDAGVDAVQIRRGARVKLYADAERYDDPGKAPLVWRFEGKARACRALLPNRAKGSRFSFFDLEDGLIADVSFLRVTPGAAGVPGTPLVPAGPADAGDLAPFLAARFPEKPALYGLGEGKPAEIVAEPGKTLHFLSDPLPAETSLGGIALNLEIPDAPTGCPLTAAIQDPLNPRAELMGVDLSVRQAGPVAVTLDFPDQVVPAGRRLWVSLTFGARVTLSQARVTPMRIPREQAIPQALAYRKLMMKGLFCQLSEARQWGLIKKNTDVEKFYKENHWGEGVRELSETIAQARVLGPKDDTVRCYDEWFSRSFRDLPPFEPRIDQAPGAPEWAVLARQAWLAARDVPKWWLDHRLVPTGEFGGEVGDDTDMYQNYADFPMLESDGVGARVKEAAALLAELAEAENLEHGLNKRTMDSLHAYEEGVNHEALMLWWNYGDPVTFERCLAAAKAMPSLMTVTERGHRHFKHDDCGAEDLRTDRPLGWDGGYHPLMLHPSFEVAWYNRSPKVLQYLREWGDAWLDHQQPGDYATAVDVKTEKATQTDKARPLRGGGQACAHTFLYDLTGDLRYIRPFMDFWEKGTDVWPARDYVPEMWHRGALDGVPEKEREAVLRGSKMAAGIALGDRQALYEALRADIAELQRFGTMYTDAELFTDRVFLYASANATRCYTGGFATRNRFHHPYAASWEGFGTDYAALVLRARPDYFRVLIYNFRPAPMSGKIRLWTLDHGRYQLTLGPDANGDDTADKVTRSEALEVGRATPVSLTLPPKQVVVLELRQTEKLDPLWERADLALSPLGVKLENGVVTGTVHNIGSKEVAEVVVALLDASGKERARQKLGSLAAPLDLDPKRIPFRFEGLKPGPGWRVVVDPDGRVPEITEENNGVTVR